MCRGHETHQKGDRWDRLSGGGKGQVRISRAAVRGDGQEQA